MKKQLCALLCVSLLSAFALCIPSAAAAVWGDMNDDGKVSADDARIILRASVKLDTLNAVQEKYADLDNDSKITASDARLALRIAVRLDEAPDFPDSPDLPDEPATDPEEPTTENPLNYIGPDYSPERAGLVYDSFGYISTYEAIKEGDSYYYYTDTGYLFGEIKPYSPGNEPVHDLTKCSHCGKKTQSPNNEHYACYYEGYCSRWVMDIICPECGVFVKGGTCHTCDFGS